MMGIGGRPGWVHYFVQAGYSVYWLDRPSYGRSPVSSRRAGSKPFAERPAVRRPGANAGGLQHSAVAWAREA